MDLCIIVNSDLNYYRIAPSESLYATLLHINAYLLV